MSLDTPASNLPYTHRLLVADSAASTGLTVTLQNQSPNRFNGTMPVCETSINGAPYAIDPYCTLKSYNMYNTTCYCSYPTNPGSIQFAAMVVTSPTSQPTPLPTPKPTARPSNFSGAPSVAPTFEPTTLQPTNYPTLNGAAPTPQIVVAQQVDGVGMTIGTSDAFQTAYQKAVASSMGIPFNNVVLASIAPAADTTTSRRLLAKSIIITSVIQAPKGVSASALTAKANTIISSGGEE